MKILYSHRTRSADGQYVHIRALTDALKALGHEVSIAGPDDGEGKKLAAGSSAASWLPAPIHEIAEYAYSYIGQAKLARLAQEFTPDILYERYNLFYSAGMRVKRRFNLPMMLEVNAPLSEERALHGALAFHAFAKQSEQIIWRAADIVLPVSHVMADYVRAAGVPDERIQVIQNGVSDDFLKPVDGATVRDRYGLGGKLVLGFTGFVRAWHGVDKILRFLAAHRDENLHLLLVGDGPARAALEKLARELDIADRVTITGVVQPDDLAAHVAVFDIALQPAVTPYASPLKLFEYMALGKPILAPASANIRETLTDNEDALLFDGEENFDKALLALVKDQALRARLGTAAKESLLTQDLTWTGNARRVTTIAETLLRARHDHQN